MRPIIYLLDDDSLTLWMLESMLASVDAEIRGYTSATRFFDEYQPTACECLVTDLRMPELSGLDVQQRLLAQGATLPIIFVSGQAEIRSAVAAMRGGALDFLEKPVQGQLLVEKVRRALARSLELHAARRQQVDSAERLRGLTVREREVAELVATGRSSREIAEVLDLSQRTVENHRARVMEKLGVRTSIELVQCLNRAVGTPPRPEGPGVRR